MAFVSNLSETSTGVNAWRLHPEAYEFWGPFAGAIMRTQSEMSDAEKELIGAYSSAMRGCQHCYTAHYPVAVVYGIDPKLFEDVMQDPWEAPIDEKFKPILAYVRKLCREPHKLMQADVDAILDKGWSERTVTDAIMISALFGFMNTMMMGYGADKIDLSAMGPIQALVRKRGQYGHGGSTGRESVSPELIAEAREIYGDEPVDQAVDFYRKLGRLEGQ